MPLAGVGSGTSEVPDPDTGFPCFGCPESRASQTEFARLVACGSEWRRGGLYPRPDFFLRTDTHRRESPLNNPPATEHHPSSERFAGAFLQVMASARENRGRRVAPWVSIGSPSE